MSDAVGQYFQGITKEFSFDPATGAFSSDLIDFSKATGPEVYQFNGALDDVCSVAGAADPMHEVNPKCNKQYNYECFDHMTFQDNSVATTQLHKDIVITLGAQALAATAVAAVAAFALF